MSRNPTSLIILEGNKISGSQLHVSLAQLDWLLSIFWSTPAWKERGWPAEGVGRGQLTTPLRVNHENQGMSRGSVALPSGHLLCPSSHSSSSHTVPSSAVHLLIRLWMEYLLPSPTTEAPSLRAFVPFQPPFCNTWD